jgi:hypothetical protein
MHTKLFHYTGLVKFSSALHIRSAKDNIKQLINEVDEDGSKSIFEQSYLRDPKRQLGIAGRRLYGHRAHYRDVISVIDHPLDVAD